MIIPMTQMGFSVPGSYLVLNHLTAKHTWELQGRPEGLYLRLVDCHGRKITFGLEPCVHGAATKYTLSATPGALTIETSTGEIEITFDNLTTLIARGRGLSLRLSMVPESYEYVEMRGANRVLVHAATARTQFALTSVKGVLHVDAPYGQHACEHIAIDFLPDEDGVFHAAIEQYAFLFNDREYDFDFDARAAGWTAKFEKAASALPACENEWRDTLRLAAYCLWNAEVAKQGFMTRRGILMSKVGMNNVWTWDSAINAMALSLYDTNLAYEQICVPFDYQHDSGLLPDYVNPFDVLWEFTKPPIHGMAMMFLLRSGASEAMLAEIYPKLEKQVSYWLTYADSDGDGIAQYGHGNDCGWDNCTSFSAGPPIEGPDLSSFLIIQMEALSGIAEKLGKPAEAAAWQDRSEALLQCLIKHSYDGENFIVYQSGSHKTPIHGDSLYPYLPLMLGHRLPRDIFASLVRGLTRENRFMTEYGLATESISSDQYVDDGYWRGPIWAPPMLLIVYGLLDGGEDELARELARRFLRLMNKSGFAENFDAKTGAPLRDPAYTWTASTYICFACDVLKP